MQLAEIARWVGKRRTALQLARLPGLPRLTINQLEAGLGATELISLLHLLSSLPLIAFGGKLPTLQPMAAIV